MITNVRLGCNWLVSTDALAYNAAASVTTVKSFIVENLSSKLILNFFLVHETNCRGRGLTCLKNQLGKNGGQISDACRISATRIAAPKVVDSSSK
jgi:hypothetical protein